MTQSVSPVWDDACLAACLCALAPAELGGIAVRAASGGVRDQWLDGMKMLLSALTPFRRVPLDVSDSRLLGGLDLCATLAAGRPVSERGILHEATGGLVVLAMAERIAPTAAARFISVLDTRCVILERDGLSASYSSEIGIIALDESEEGDAGLAASLKDRLALHLDLRGVSGREISEFLWSASDIGRAATIYPEVRIDDQLVHALCSTALALGIDSLRAPLLACRVARAVAALQGRRQVEQGDVACAARLVLAPRATTRPSAPESCQQPAPDAGEQHSEKDATNAEQNADATADANRNANHNANADSSDQGELPSISLDSLAEQDANLKRAPDDAVLAAAVAALPAGLLGQLKPAMASRSTGHAGASGGRAGLARDSLTRGRPVGSRRGELSGNARLHLLATLRAAAPWQALRRREMLTSASAAQTATVKQPRVHIRRQDFAIRRFVQRAQTTTIFVVDASGSSALHRLAEAKGAVEQLLAECYIRRDRVAVLGFRHQSAELLLPPTRSLVRARRSLAAMPANGGTPLAAAIDASAALADSVRRHGDTPFIVLLSDGKANVARDGSHDRVQARLDAISAGGALRAAQLTALFVDTSPRANVEAHHVADSMGAQYVALPYADSTSLCSAIRAAMA